MRLPTESVIKYDIIRVKFAKAQKAGENVHSKSRVHGDTGGYTLSSSARSSQWYAGLKMLRNVLCIRLQDQLYPSLLL